MAHYVTVKDHKGEMFEVTVANARDLVRHLGWQWMGTKKIEAVAEMKPTPSVPTAEVAPPVLFNLPPDPVPAPSTPAVEVAPVVEAAPAPVAEEVPAPEPSPTTRKRN
jgi:hypothetical protein